MTFSKKTETITTATMSLRTSSSSGRKIFSSLMIIKAFLITNTLIDIFLDSNYQLIPKCLAQHNVQLRICVPDAVYEDCLQMSDNNNGLFRCINARDKFECLQLVDNDEADVVNVDAEDLFVAGMHFQLEPFVMEEYNGNRYLQRSAVVIKKGSSIRRVDDLRHRRVCLGPYNEIYQWNIPIGILLELGKITSNCEGDELGSVENFFHEACAAGNWSSDPFLDNELKQKHRRLCTLCKDSTFNLCSENDPFGGPEGSLRCLLESNAEVAFTTIETAVNFFSRRPSEFINYEFLCLDNDRMNINSRGCTWARHPTNTFVIRKGRDRIKDLFVRTLQHVFRTFVKIRPSWFDKSFVSSRNVTDLVKIPMQIPSAPDLPKYAHYLNSFAASIGKTLMGCREKRNVTFCLSKEGELNKCQQLQRAAYARRIRPIIFCYQADSEQTCIRLLNERKVDLMVLPPDHYYYAARYQSVQALAVETSDNPKYSVAVIRDRAADSGLRMLAQLKGKRSCHGGFGNLAGWTIPIGYLIHDQLVETNSCNRAQVIVDYFSGSCAPGAADARINPNGTGVAQLCSQCIGDEQGLHHCDLDFGERYSGEEGAIRCLVEGRGDVAFVSHDVLQRLTRGRRFPFDWSSNLKPSDFRLLCRIPADIFDARTGGFLPVNSIDGQIDSTNRQIGKSLLDGSIDDHARCHIARIPDSIIVTSSFTPVNKRLEAMTLLNQLSDVFLDNHRQQSFKLSGVFANRTNVLFSDHINHIRILRPDATLAETLGDFLPLLMNNDPITCRGYNIIPIHWVLSISISFISFMAIY